MKVTLTLLVIVTLGAGVAIAEGPKLRVVDGRGDTRIQFESDGETAIIDVNSKSGIGRATIKREVDGWPKLILVRLHLKGLEAFSAGGKGDTVEWSVSSSGEDRAARVSLRGESGETRLTADSPYFAAVRIVGGETKIPLQNGYFEIRLPAKLFEGNPPEIKLAWVDFFRS